MMNGFRHQPARGDVIRVPVFPVMRQYHLGTVFPQYANDFEPRLRSYSNFSIGKAEVFADFQLEYRGRPEGFLPAQSGGSASAEFSARHIRDAGQMAKRGHFGQGSAGKKLHIIGVRTKSQYVQMHRSIQGQKLVFESQDIQLIV
jgi:hypothetical protein